MTIAETTTADREDTEEAEDTEEDTADTESVRTADGPDGLASPLFVPAADLAPLCPFVCYAVQGGRDDYRSRAPQQSRGNRLYVANIHGADVPALEKLFDKYGRIVDM